MKAFYRLYRLRKYRTNKLRMITQEFDPFEIIDFDHRPVISFEEDNK